MVSQEPPGVWPWDTVAGYAGAAMVRWQDVILAAGNELGFGTLRDMTAEALQDALPELREDPDLARTARSSGAANLALVFSIVRGDVSATEVQPPPAALAFTRELARRNVPVTELERAYRVTAHALWKWGVAQLRERIADAAALSAAIEGLSEATFATGDALSAMVVRRYAQERERWVRSADAVRADAVGQLLSGRPIDAAGLGRRLGYELAGDHRAFVCWSEAENAVPETAAAAFGGPRALLVALGVGLVAGWVPASVGLDREASGVSVAVGLPGRGTRGFRRSHEQAMEARRVMVQFGSRSGAVVYDEVARLALLTRDRTGAGEYAARVLGPLAGEDASARRLATTLHAVLEEQGSPRRAAQRLGVHENTVAKRMRTVDGLLGVPRPPVADLLAALTIALA
jgi:hypothetical protein